MSGVAARFVPSVEWFRGLSLRTQTVVLYTPVVVLAAVLRLAWLGSPRALVFDEVYYVRDAWTLWNLGYEGKWPDGVDFVTGGGTGFSSEGVFIAHPPLGKWIIGLGMTLFGPSNPFAWRIMTAVCGILVVLFTMFIARRLFSSLQVAALAGFIVAVDGLAITMSRTALLDGILTMFVLAAFLALLRHLDSPHSGWWLVVAGVLLGAATAVKWSGLYAIAAFGMWVLVTEVWRFHRANPAVPLAPAAAFRAVRALILGLFFAALTYLVSWSGWLLTAGGYDRNPTEGEGVIGALRSLIDYHRAIYGYNIGLTTPHGYQANPFGWLLMIRPTAFYYDTSCGSGCTEYITSVANPVTWWAGVGAMVAVIVLAIRRRWWPGGAIAAGVAGTYLPWLFFAHRTVFQFYTVSLEPFLALALAWVLVELWRRGWVSVSRGIVVAATVVSAFFMPVWWGIPIPVWFAAAHYWFLSWI